jgi:Rieske Fe-S protein
MSELTDAGATRRTVLLGVGAVGATAALAACGSSTPAPSSVPAPSANDPGPATSSATVQAIKVSDIHVGGGAIYPEQGVVVTQPAAGQFKAFSAVCTHMGCTVARIDGGKIICPCHGSQYNIADGSVAQGPATRPLAPKTATVTGDTITVS